MAKPVPISVEAYNAWRGARLAHPQFVALRTQLAAAVHARMQAQATVDRLRQRRRAHGEHGAGAISSLRAARAQADARDDEIFDLRAKLRALG